jgi:hypothetical protein
MLDNARSDLDELILKHQSSLETTLWLLYNRPDIIKKTDMEISVKKDEYIRIVGKSKAILLDSSVIKESGTCIFQSKVCLRHDIDTLTITPQRNLDHWVWLETRKTLEDDVAAFEVKRKTDFVTQKEMAATNKLLGIGSRVPGRNKLKISSDMLTPALKYSSSQFLSSASFKTTCDTDGSDSTSCSSSQKTLSANLDRFDDNGSTPIAEVTASGQNKLQRVSEVANLNLSDYESDDDEEYHSERNKRTNEVKRKRHNDEEEEEEESGEFSDLIVKDGECESVESGDEVVSLRCPKSVSDSKSYYDLSKDDDDEYQDDERDEAKRREEQEREEAEYLAKEERETQKYKKVVSSVLGAVQSEQKRLKPVRKSSPTTVKTETKSARGSTTFVKVENPLGVPEEKYKPQYMRKKTKGEYEVSYVEEIEVHVHNKLYSKVVVNGADGSHSMVIRNPQELQDANKELDIKFISFLVEHTATMVGSEIALERCIVDYVLKKQKLNGLDQMEQQEISNWKTIFINIENLISNQVRKETTAKKDLLDDALKATIELIENDFRIKRNELRKSDDFSLQDESEALHQLRKDADLKIDAASEMTSGLKALLDITMKTTNQKINTTIHYIAVKVCVYWAQINNCLDVIEPALVEKYANRFLQHDHLKEQLASAKATGMLLMSAQQCEHQPYAAEDTTGSLVAEEKQLRSIIGGEDHAEGLMNAIYSVKAKTNDMISLVEVLWSKKPRTKLSTAVAVKKEKPGKSSETAGTGVVVEDLLTTSDLVVNVATLSSPSGQSSTHSAPGAWTQTTLTNMDGKLGFSQQSRFV